MRKHDCHEHECTEGYSIFKGYLGGGGDLKCFPEGLINYKDCGGGGGSEGLC